MSAAVRGGSICDADVGIGRVDIGVGIGCGTRGWVGCSLCQLSGGSGGSNTQLDLRVVWEWRNFRGDGARFLCFDFGRRRRHGCRIWF